MITRRRDWNCGSCFSRETATCIHTASVILRVLPQALLSSQSKKAKNCKYDDHGSNKPNDVVHNSPLKCILLTRRECDSVGSVPFRVLPAKTARLVAHGSAKLLRDEL